MASTVAPGCPVHSEFDPLSPRYLQDPFTVLRELPAREAAIFYAPAIDYYVVTRYEDVEAIFLDPLLALLRRPRDDEQPDRQRAATHTRARSSQRLGTTVRQRRGSDRE
jgi:hypothetical protein